VSVLAGGTVRREAPEGPHVGDVELGRYGEGEGGSVLHARSSDGGGPFAPARLPASRRGETAPVGPSRTMEPERTPDLVEALLDLASLATQILAHMARWEGHSAPDASPPEQVFRELLAETLRPVLERRAPAEIEAARRLLVEAVATIEDEILLIEPSPHSRVQKRRSRAPRRPR
jgi:hypothetical protein